MNDKAESARTGNNLKCEYYERCERTVKALAKWLNIIPGFRICRTIFRRPGRLCDYGRGVSLNAG